MLVLKFMTGIAAAAKTAPVSKGIIDISPLPNTKADSTALQSVNTIVFTIVTLVALIIIVVAGLRYIVARGDPNATAQARNTIVYAVVGLVVVLIAYGIVTFVLKGIS